MKKIILIISIALLAQAATDFSVVYIPDTQNWTRVPSRRYKFKVLTQWVVDNKDSLNIIFVSHVGDMVCRDEASAEFNAAIDGMDILENAGVPYGISPGNHDGNMESENGEFKNYNKYFPITKFNTKPWFGGNFPEGKSNNIYFTLTCKGLKLLFLHIVDHSYYPKDYMKEGRSWAKEVVKNHPDHKIFITTHAYMGSSGGYLSGGRAVWDDVIYPSNNVHILVCGHIDGEICRVDKTESGQSVIQMLTDWQGFNNDTWDATCRILEFDLTNDKMTSSVFNTWSETYPPAGNGGNFTYDHPLGDITIPIKNQFAQPAKQRPSNIYRIYDMKGRIIPREEFTKQNMNTGNEAFQIYIVQFKDKGEKISVYKKIFQFKDIFSHL